MREKQGKCTKSKNLIFIDSMQRQSPWQHSSPALSSFHSPPPLALLADKVYRHPPTPSDYDMFSLMECWQARPTAFHSLPQVCLLSDAAFNILLLYFQLHKSVFSLLKCPLTLTGCLMRQEEKFIKRLWWTEVWLGAQLRVCVLLLSVCRWGSWSVCVCRDRERREGMSEREREWRAVIHSWQ